jgi:hypothetical protein
MPKYRVYASTTVSVTRDIEAADRYAAEELAYETFPRWGSILTTEHEYLDCGEWEVDDLEEIE